MSPESFFESGENEEEILAMDDSERFRFTPFFFSWLLVVDLVVWLGRAVSSSLLTPLTTNFVKLSTDVDPTTSASFAQVTQPFSAPFPFEFVPTAVVVSLDGKIWVEVGGVKVEG
jgi:hypothetical protein